jgi:hypothetical protein
LFKKSNRFYTSITFGVIAFNVFEIAKTLVPLNSEKQIKINDPSGLAKLAFRVAEMFLVNIYYLKS